MNRVVVTGIGAVTPIGNDAQTTWKGMKSGKNGIGFITRFDTEEFKVKVAAEVKDFDPTLYLEKKEIRKPIFIPSTPWPPRPRLWRTAALSALWSRNGWESMSALESAA